MAVFRTGQSLMNVQPPVEEGTKKPLELVRTPLLHMVEKTVLETSRRHVNVVPIVAQVSSFDMAFYQFLTVANYVDSKPYWKWTSQ